MTKDFQQQLLHLVNKIEKIEDLCKEETAEPFGPYLDAIDFMRVLEGSKKINIFRRIRGGNISYGK